MYERALEIIREQYLYLDDMSVSDAHIKAAEAAEDAIDWLIVTQEADQIVLRHGELGEFARQTVIDQDLAALQEGLQELEGAIASGPGILPEEVDVPVELLRGVSRALDRHSVVMYRDRLQRFNERIRGKLTGVGSQIRIVDEQPVVQEVFPDSPALRGGLEVGDVILEIDGFSTVGLTMDQIVSRIRGEAETTVSLLISRGEEQLELQMTRAEVRVPNVKWSYLPSGIGTIQITSFSEQTTHFLHQSLADFRASGALNGIIIDLRGNTGGSMRQACYSVDQFLTSGTVLRTEGRNGGEVRGLMRRFPARVDGSEPEVPVVILVDRRSASASEILAGALMLSDRAVIIGEQTHGKGTVQRRESLRMTPGDRVEMKLTVAEYKLTDEGIPIQYRVGLEPDLWVLPATFSRGGVALPALATSRTSPQLIYADEKPGWREGIALLKDDQLAMMAEEILLAVPPGEWGRHEVLRTMNKVLPRIRTAHAASLEQTFQYRGIDWSASPAVEADAGLLDVALSVVDPPIAGEAVEVRAVVDNRGPSPLHQVQIRLSADSDLPWDGLTLPVGFVAPGERGFGSVMVTLPAGEVSRVDLVTPTTYAQRSEPVVQPPSMFAIDGRPHPHIAASASLLRTGNGQKELFIELENMSSVPLPELQAQFLLPNGTSIELEERELSFAPIPPSGRGQSAVAIRVPEGAQDEALQLKVDAEGWGRVLSVPLQIREEGTDRVIPPRISAALPTEVPVGELDVTVVATDDQQIASVTVWWDNAKVAWSDGGPGRDELLLPVTIGADHHVLTVRAVDDQGAVVKQRFHVQGTTDRLEADAQLP